MDRGFWLSLIRDWGTALAAVVLLYAMWANFFAPSPLSSGDAPHFALASTDGVERELAHEPGLHVLNFWFTSCGPCRAEIPELSRFSEENPDVPVWGISTDRMDTKKLGIESKRLGVTYPVLHDANSQVSGAYGVSMFPTTIIVKDGEIVDTVMGGLDRARLEALVAPHRGAAKP